MGNRKKQGPADAIGGRGTKGPSSPRVKQAASRPSAAKAPSKRPQHDVSALREMLKLERARSPEGSIGAIFRATVSAMVGPNASFADREEAGLSLANALCAEDQEEELGDIARRFDCDEIEIDGTRYRRHEMGRGEYGGLCGKLRPQRATFRLKGVRNGPTVDPVSRAAGMIEGATPKLAYAIAHGYALGPSRAFAAMMKSADRRPPSRKMTERIAKDIGAAMKAAVVVIEPIVRSAEILVEGAQAIVVGLDRTSVPMEEAAGSNPDAKPDRKKRSTPYIRQAPAAIEVNYRMAYVGTVSVVDVDGRVLETRRYGAPASEHAYGMVARMQQDVLHLRGQRPSLPLLIVQDGAVEMWKLARSVIAQALRFGEKASEAIDRHHLLERLSDALKLVNTAHSVRASQLAAWNAALDTDDAAIDTIEVAVRAMRDAHRGTVRTKLYDHLTYIENNKDRMRYAALRRAGLPVGSGPTEGACKSLVMIRAKGCGQRWHDDGIESVLELRALEMSGRLPAMFVELRRHSYDREVTAIRAAA
jgi:hypothetical protein